MRQLADAISEASGRAAEIEAIPSITEDTYRLVGDIAKVRKLGYEPRRSLVESVREIVLAMGERPRLPGGATIFRRGQSAERDQSAAV